MSKAVRPKSEPMSFQRASKEIGDAMNAAIKRLETIQETHPDIELGDDLLRYRNALYWFRKIPSPATTEWLWTEGGASEQSKRKARALLPTIEADHEITRRQAADDMVDALYRLLPYPENGEEAKAFVAEVLEEFWRE